MHETDLAIVISKLRAIRFEICETGSSIARKQERMYCKSRQSMLECSQKISSSKEQTK